MTHSDYRKIVFIRLLIASYFMALAGYEVGVKSALVSIDHTPLDHLIDLLRPAGILAAAFFLLIGLYVRRASLLLALIVFWTSHMTHYGQDGTADMLSYFNDLALIGAMCAFTCLPQPRNPRFMGLRLRRSVKPRRIIPKTHKRRVQKPRDQVRDISFVAADEPKITNIFADLENETVH